MDPSPVRNRDDATLHNILYCFDLPALFVSCRVVVKMFHFSPFFFSLSLHPPHHHGREMEKKCERSKQVVFILTH